MLVFYFRWEMFEGFNRRWHAKAVKYARAIGCVEFGKISRISPNRLGHKYRKPTKIIIL